MWICKWWATRLCSIVHLLIVIYSHCRLHILLWLYMLYVTFELIVIFYLFRWACRIEKYQNYLNGRQLKFSLYIAHSEDLYNNHPILRINICLWTHQIRHDLVREDFNPQYVPAIFISRDLTRVRVICFLNEPPHRNRLANIYHPNLFIRDASVTIVKRLMYGSVRSLFYFTKFFPVGVSCKCQ